MRIIVPAAAGGNLDIIVRQVAQNMPQILGQPVIIENRPGAALLVGTQYVAKSPPDGYTLLATANTFAGAPWLLKDVGYDPIKDFVGISALAEVPMVVLVGADSEIKNLGQLVAQMKSSPDKVSYGTAGAGSAAHIVIALLMLQTGGKGLHVPFKGAAPALLEVMAGRVTMTADTLTAALPHLRSGRLRALAVSSTRRSPILPDVPTVAETGIPGVNVAAWNGLLAPAGTPQAVLDKVNAAVNKAMTPELRKKLLEDGAELIASARPQQYSEFIRDQVNIHARVIREANIKAE